MIYAYAKGFADRPRIRAHILLCCKWFLNMHNQVLQEKVGKSRVVSVSLESEQVDLDFLPLVTVMLQ